MIIPGFSRYSIDVNGVVTNVTTGQTLKARTVRIRNSCYKQITLKDDSGNTSIYNVMSLLALAYLGKPLHEGAVVAKDGDNLNTTLDNVVCVKRSDITKQTWLDGKMADRCKRNRCYNTDSISMVYEAMQAYDEPVTMVTLSNDLNVPYATVHYSMIELRKRRRVRKTEGGFEVVR